MYVYVFILKKNDWLWSCADEREDLTNVDSDKFNSIINEVESLHHFGTHLIFFPFTVYSYGFLLMLVPT